MFPRSRAFLAVLVGLLALNLLISFLTGGPAERRQVPYQPFFLEQVEAGNVQELSSREDSIEGELKRPATYDPPGDAEPARIDRFKTQIPAFIDRASLTRLVTEQEVVINAEPPDTGRSFWLTLLLGFAPALLLVGFFLWLARRQLGAGGGGVLGGFGLAGIDEAEQELVAPSRQATKLRAPCSLTTGVVSDSPSGRAPQLGLRSG